MRKTEQEFLKFLTDKTKFNEAYEYMFKYLNCVIQ